MENEATKTLRIDSFFNLRNHRVHMNKFNIIIADDHPVLRLGLKAMFEGNDRINVIGEAKSGKELMEKVKHLIPDVILLDYFFGEDNAAKLTKAVHKISKKIKILVFSFSSEPIIVQKTLKAGAAGFICKSDSHNLLTESLYSIMSGKQSFSPTIQPIVDRLRNTNDHNLQELTQREIEILEYVANEFSNKEIGAQLFISPRTVETHKRNIMQKLKLKNSVGLVNYYFRVMHAGTSV